MINKLELLKNSDFILCFGHFLPNINNKVVDALCEAKLKNNAEVIYMHPIDNVILKKIYTQFIKYEAGSEEGLSVLLLKTLAFNVTTQIQKYIKNLDIGYICAESNVGEEELEEILKKSQNKKSKVFLLGDEVFTHTREDNIIKVLNIIEKYGKLTILSSKNLKKNENENIKEIEEILPYNGTVIYSYIDTLKDTNTMYSSPSFTNIVKVEDGTKVVLKSKGGEVLKTLKTDNTLQGTIAICPTKSKNKDFLSNGYVYKPVKIEKAKK